MSNDRTNDRTNELFARAQRETDEMFARHQRQVNELFSRKTTDIKIVIDRAGAFFGLLYAAVMLVCAVGILIIGGHLAIGLTMLVCGLVIAAVDLQTIWKTRRQ